MINNETNNKLICLVGMPGAGKTEVSNYLLSKRSFGYFRFGQIVLDKIKESGQKPNEKLEREIREGLRQEHGMAAMAILNLPKMEALLKQGDVVGDGLYSWEEYLFLKEKFGKQFITIAVYAPPKIRYERLINRSDNHKDDPQLKYRSFTREEVWLRDKSEIENLHKAGPIAMADYVVQNTGTQEELYKQIDKILDNIQN